MEYQYPIIANILADNFNAYQQKERCPYSDSTKYTVEEWIVSAMPKTPEKILSTAHLGSYLCSILPQSIERVKLNPKFNFYVALPELLLSFETIIDDLSKLSKNISDRVSELLRYCEEDELKPSIISLWSLYTFLKSSSIINLNKWGLVVSFKGEFCLNIDQGKNQNISLRFDDNGEVEFLIFTPKISSQHRYIYTGTTSLNRLDAIIMSSDITKFI